jgi:hypothetical protein
VIGPIDVAASIVDVEYVNCAGSPIIRPNELAGTFNVCGQRGSIPLIYRQDLSPIEDSSVTVTTNCCTVGPTIPSSLNWDYSKIPPSEGNLLIYINGYLVLLQTTNGTGSLPCNVGDILYVEATPSAITDTADLTITSLSGLVFNQALQGSTVISGPITILPGEAPYLVDANFYDISV